MKKIISSLLLIGTTVPAFAALTPFEKNICTTYQAQVQNTINPINLRTSQTYVSARINSVTKDANNNIFFSVNNISECQGFCSPNDLSQLNVRLTNANRTFASNYYLTNIHPGDPVEVCGSFVMVNNQRLLSVGIPEVNVANLQNPGYLNINGTQSSLCNGNNAFCIDLLTIQNAH